ncbi:hypothetical protein H0H81_009937 [Sphagnurus paluster]|uniref:Uncharacterized protein n=1 Tax=Sphagnurus paluster TaxID=117069 RepID=A0A9P7GPH8_9AGAR|nr:hypothetical protein H0H81_009937 [Sphagnurus paluster]
MVDVDYIRMDEESSSEDTSTAKLVKETYGIAWNEFYAWEQDHCLRTLHSLARPLPGDQYSTCANPSIYHKRSEPLTTLPISLEALPSVSSNTNEEFFTVVEYSNEAKPHQTTTLPAQTTLISPLLEACAPYEVCTPINRNINVGDDSEYMPFIPLVDDPTFDHAPHAADYNYFEWQLPNRDPDLGGEMPMAEPAPATVPTEALAHSVEAMCGAECFLRGKTLAHNIMAKTNGDPETGPARTPEPATPAAHATPIRRTVNAAVGVT